MSTVRVWGLYWTPKARLRAPQYLCSLFFTPRRPVGRARYSCVVVLGASREAPRQRSLVPIRDEAHPAPPPSRDASRSLRPEARARPVRAARSAWRWASCVEASGTPRPDSRHARARQIRAIGRLIGNDSHRELSDTAAHHALRDHLVFERLRGAPAQARVATRLPR